MEQQPRLIKLMEDRNTLQISQNLARNSAQARSFLERPL